MNRVIELPLTDAGRKPLAAIGIIVAILAFSFTCVILGMYLHSPQSKDIAPIATLCAVSIVLLPLVLFRIVGRARATIDGGDLVLQTGVGVKRIALTRLRRHGLQIVNLTLHPEFKPRLRTWGASMPGLSAGWFRLRNGDKAVCLLTDQRRVTYLRTDSDSLTLLLSLKNPEILRQIIEG
jgi:hypothetical protein